VILVNLQKDRRAKWLNLTRMLLSFISEMVMNPFRNREMPIMSKFGKMTGGSEIQKYKLVT